MTPEIAVRTARTGNWMRRMIWTALIVLLAIVLTMNALAIFLRSHFRQNW